MCDRGARRHLEARLRCRGLLVRRLCGCGCLLCGWRTALRSRKLGCCGELRDLKHRPACTSTSSMCTRSDVKIKLHPLEALLMMCEATLPRR